MTSIYEVAVAINNNNYLPLLGLLKSMIILVLPALAFVGWKVLSETKYIFKLRNKVNLLLKH